MLPKQINPRAGFFELQNSANTGSLGSEHHLSWVHENKQKTRFTFQAKWSCQFKKTSGEIPHKRKILQEVMNICKHVANKLVGTSVPTNLW